MEYAFLICIPLPNCNFVGHRQSVILNLLLNIEGRDAKSTANMDLDKIPNYLGNLDLVPVYSGALYRFVDSNFRRHS